MKKEKAGIAKIFVVDAKELVSLPSTNEIKGVYCEPFNFQSTGNRISKYYVINKKDIKRTEYDEETQTFTSITLKRGRKVKCISI